MSAHAPSDRFSKARALHADDHIARLRAPLLLQHQTCNSYRIIMALRLMAVCNRSGHDPLPLLAHRLANVGAARAVLAFADQVGMCWPENVQVMRPCCGALSHDEWTIGLLADAAAAGQRNQFSAILDGLVRQSRHERLYDLAKAAVALLP